MFKPNTCSAPEQIIADRAMLLAQLKAALDAGEISQEDLDLVSNPESKFQMHWSVTKTGHTGFAPKLYDSIEEVQDVVDSLNAEHAGEIEHWVEVVLPEKETEMEDGSIAA